jgi:glycosyltransferase involved in cell wall biosynthesis
VRHLPAERLVRYPLRELLRTAASRAHVGAPWVDRLWDGMAQAFDRTVAKRHVPGAARIYAFEYTALATFRRARALGVQTVLDLPSLDSQELERQLEREYADDPSMASADHPYFQARFAARYQRRQDEIALADVLVANSRLTAESHVRAGADPARVRVVPLAGPAPVPHLAEPDPRAPLQVLWASGVTQRKGAHHFFEAWRRLDAGAHARAHMYGGLRMPPGLLGAVPQGLEFHGSVSQDELFAAMARADVLVFPTLSDGFGMVVSEALAHGVPVIVSDQAGAADRIEHGVNGFVFPAGDVAALHRHLQWCLDERESLARMRLAAHRSAAQWQWSDYREAIRKACA